MVTLGIVDQEGLLATAAWFASKERDEGGILPLFWYGSREGPTKPPRSYVNRDGKDLSTGTEVKHWSTLYSPDDFHKVFKGTRILKNMIPALQQVQELEKNLAILQVESSMAVRNRIEPVYSLGAAIRITDKISINPEGLVAAINKSISTNGNAGFLKEEDVIVRSQGHDVQDGSGGQSSLEVMINTDPFYDPAFGTIYLTKNSAQFKWRGNEEWLSNLTMFIKVVEHLLNGALEGLKLKESPNYTLFLAGKWSDIYSCSRIESVNSIPIISRKGEINRAHANRQISNATGNSEKSLEQKLTFDDVVGCEEAKARLQTYLEYVKNPEIYLTGGVETPRGAILVGPPGTGKTLLARVLADQTDKPFIEVRPQDYKDMWHGNTERFFAEILDRAKQKGAVLFFDEFETIAKEQKQLPGWEAPEKDVVAELRRFIDGFTPQDNVYIIGATNYPEQIDEGILSRIPVVTVGLPNHAAREKIIMLEMKKSVAYAIKKSREAGISEDLISRIRIYDPEIDVSAAAGEAKGLSGRDLHNINEILKINRVNLLNGIPAKGAELEYLIGTSDWVKTIKDYRGNIDPIMRQKPL